jgi:hypothetical protein
MAFVFRQFYFRKPVVVALCIGIIFQYSACTSRKVSPEQSRKILKAFDYELIQIANRFSNTQAFRAIMLARKLQGVQLPFLSTNDTLAETNLATYNLQLAKGVFYFSSLDSLPQKTANSDSLILVFPSGNKESDAPYKMIISEFAERQTDLGMLFPEAFEAVIFKGDQKVGSLKYSASFKHEMPASVSININAGNFNIEVQLETIFRKKKSLIEIHFTLHENDKQLILVTLDTEVAETKTGSLAYDKKHIEIEVFPLNVIVDSEYNFSEGKVTDFFREFNDQSVIKLFDTEGQMLGNVKLEQTEGRSRINLMMYYNDGSSENLEDFLLTVKKVLNMKTSMPG